MDVAMVGLGRMGGNMARRLLRGGHRVVVWNRTYAKAQELESEGADAGPELATSWRTAGAARHLAHAAPRRRPRRTPSTSWCRCSPQATSSSTAATRTSSDDIARGAKPSAERGIRYLRRGHQRAACGVCRWATA